ncbi:hypothetical protein [Streptoalloteichus hindustanus]|uniref:Uncharacterized protein n=1 Tax=Streptoalloteichus hindustanus TaxID=2017 RepID=A0A1M5P1D5_STRHI|nr:hypothetical protein [Streptoalloteichus hindustanus]SHG95517.1 hypothetical protein SAMN05444320_11734 [Streptoalloteichus hindustanus]
MNDDWPETVRGWELARHGHIENYRRRLANNVTVIAIWENKPGTGTVEARVETSGLGRTLTRSRTEFRDKEAFWTAAHCVVEMAANLPSLGAGHESPADSALCGEVAGNVEAEPGTGGAPEAELTFTLVNGRTVTLILSDDQAFDLTSRIYSLDKHVWSEQRDEFEDDEEGGEDGDEFEDGEEEADAGDADDAPGDAGVGGVEAPDVSDVQAGPDTGHDVVTLLDARFGVTEDHLMAHVDWSALIVVGEPAVSSLIERGEELTTALRPRWYPAVLDRPGEQWVVLRRANMFSHPE